MQPLPVSFKLLMLCTMFFTFMVAGLFVVGGLSYLFFGVNTFTNAGSLENVSTPEGMMMSKMAQLFLSVFSFIITSLVAAWMFSEHPMRFLRATKKPSLSLILITLLLMICSTPWINYTAELNGMMHLPQSLHFLEEMMRLAEDKAAVLTEAYLKMDNLWSLIFNIILIALIPAVGEELLFRGAIQQTLNGVFCTKIYSILITAFLFSAIHFQFYGFIPRFLLGVILGLLVEWRYFVLSVIAHLLIMVRQFFRMLLARSIDTTINQDNIGTLLWTRMAYNIEHYNYSRLLVFLFFMYRTKGRNNKSSQ
ncbi:MAG: CPBP family intramembrane metalloprotease [Bacteroidetes bacterium]|nr:CPBP family intramembrane metalloprotease [Bacteroidota bacterium]